MPEQPTAFSQVFFYANLKTVRTEVMYSVLPTPKDAIIQLVYAPVHDIRTRKVCEYVVAGLQIVLIVNKTLGMPVTPMPERTHAVCCYIRTVRIESRKKFHM